MKWIYSFTLFLIKDSIRVAPFPKSQAEARLGDMSPSDLDNRAIWIRICFQAVTASCAHGSALINRDKKLGRSHLA